MSNRTAGTEHAFFQNMSSKLAVFVSTASINPTYTYGKVIEDSGASDASSGDFIHPAQRVLRVGTYMPVCFCCFCEMMFVASKSAPCFCLQQLNKSKLSTAMCCRRRTHKTAQVKSVP